MGFSWTTTLLLAAACGTAFAGPTESDAVAAFVSGGARPGVSQAAATADRLAAASRKLCLQPGEGALRQAREAWRDAYRAWRRAEPFLFGPADKLEQRFGSWPTNAVVLDAAVSSPEYRDVRGNADVRGFPALEHLLFAPRSAKEATAGERCAHLADVSGEVAELTRAIDRAWRQDFGKGFASAGDGKPFLVPGDALGMAMTKAVGVTEHLLRERIGLPAGFFKAPPKADYLEAWLSRDTLDGFKAAVEGLRMSLSGGGEAAILELLATKDGLVEKKDPALASDIRKQLAKIERAVDGLGDGDRIRRDPAKLKGLYKQVQTLQDQLIEASLVLELDVNVIELGARTQW
ncbi:MAG: imelysin family protein [Acidobacteriota bacterium]|jgi:predicted lipoprotein|nr:imelysin family protein [Acidobacteriota bacterium]